MQTTELSTLTQELMRFRSTESRPEELMRCAEFIEHYFSETGLTVERFERNGVPSVVITKDTKHPRVFLCGHFDVVEGRDEQFVPHVDGDRLIGRGALDMKSGDAVMMVLMKSFANTSHDVGLMLTGDEEVGGFNGAGWLVQQGYSCDSVIIPDGGEAVHRVVAKEKGLMRVRLCAIGNSAHGSKPWEGTNAVLRLLQATETVRGLFVPHQEHPSDHWVSTVNVGKIEGGHAVNQVPESATAWLDIRYTESEDPAALLTRVQTALPEGVKAEVDFLEPMVFVPESHPHVQAFQAAVRTIGREPTTTLDHGSSDGRFFSAKGIPVIMSQPDGAGLHGPNEWVSISSLELYARVVQDFLDRVAK